MFILIYFDTRICFYPYMGKNEIFQIFMYNIYDKLWGDDITNSLIWIFIRTGQEIWFSLFLCQSSTVKVKKVGYYPVIDYDYLDG